MSLSCECGDDGYASFYQTQMRRARKKHLCVECRAIIMPGELYEYEVQVFDGDFSTKKTCEKCSDIAASLSELGFCWEVSDLAIAYIEYIDQYKPESRKYNEETDEYIYPENHLITNDGQPRKWNREPTEAS